MKNVLKVLTIFMLSMLSISCGVGALDINNPQIMEINRHFDLYQKKCFIGVKRKSAAPVENWRTKLMNLLNDLSEDDRKEMFIRLSFKRMGQALPNSAILDLSNCSGIVRIPCPISGQYTPELILRFIEDDTYTARYESNGTSILAMKYGANIIVI